MHKSPHYPWTRFWCRREGALSFTDDGFLLDPDAESASWYRHEHITLQHESVVAQRCVVLLGEPGIGKSTAVRQMCKDLGQDSHVVFEDLGLFSTEAQLVDRTFEKFRLIRNQFVDADVFLLLDGLDESLQRLRAVTRLLADELSRSDRSHLYFRIACRTAVWPKSFEHDLQDLFGKGAVTVLELAPLRRKDVTIAATMHSLDPERFLDEVRRVGGAALANRPITLEFLLEEFRGSNSLPFSQTSVYEKGCYQLCREHNRYRKDIGPRGELTAEQRMIVAARMAAVTVFSNLPGFTRDDAPNATGFLSMNQLACGHESVNGQPFAVTEQSIREVLDTGLFTARGDDLFGWAHKSYQEFLAAYYLKTTCCSLRQVLSLLSHHDDPEGKIVPQLRETASWLASMVGEVAEQVVIQDPEVLLGCDVLKANDALKASIVTRLLELVNTNATQCNVYDRRLTRLCYPGITDILVKIIEEPTARLVTKLIAIRIVDECLTHEAQALLLSVALDVSLPTELRVSAAHSLARSGSAEFKTRLRPLLTADLTLDHDDELKGAMLLALWPDNLSDNELLQQLTYPKNENLYGVYEMFLSDHLCQQARPEHLPALLSWASRSLGTSFRQSKLENALTRIMITGWEQIEAPGVLAPFADACLARMNGHLPILGRHSDDAKEMELLRDQSKRHMLISALVNRLAASTDGLMRLLYGDSDVLTRDDFSWLIEQLLSEPDPAHKAIWAKLVRHVFSPEQPGFADRVLQAAAVDPVLRSEMQGFLEPVDLHSETATQARAKYLEHEQLLRPRPPRKRLDLRAKLAFLIQQSGVDLCQYFWQLTREMAINPDAQQYENAFSGDLTTSQGWAEISSDMQEVILKLSLRYVRECNAFSRDWLGKPNHDYRAMAGYKALRLLCKAMPYEFANLSSDVWRMWAAAILAYPFDQSCDSEEIHKTIVAEAFRIAPTESLEALDILIEKENECGTDIYVTWQVEGCWNDGIINLLQGKALSSYLKPACRVSLVKLLLRCDIKSTFDLTTSMLQPCSDLTSTDDVLRVGVASALVTADAARAWSTIWHLTQTDATFGRRLFLHLAYWDRSYDSPFYVSLSEREQGELYLWLSDHFPVSQDEQSEGSSSVTPRMDVADVRSRVLGHLARRGTTRSVAEIERIVQARPKDEFAQRHLLGSREVYRHNSWLPPKPRDIVEMAGRSAKGIVRNGSQLLDMVEESLGRFQKEFYGTYWQVQNLWDNVGRQTDNPRPVIESKISSVIATHLQRDLPTTIVNREVQVRFNNRTDILISTFENDVMISNPQRISAVIEVKGCWNDELETAMETQLLQNYMADPGLNHGLYLVGWFYCPAWKSSKGKLKHLSLDEARARFVIQAEQMSTPKKHIRAFVLSAALNENSH